MFGHSSRKIAHRAIMSAWALKAAAMAPRIIVYRPNQSDVRSGAFRERLRMHLEWIKDQGFQGICINESASIIEARSIRSARIVAIAFHIPGGSAWGDSIVPLLQEMGFGATFFIATGLVSGNSIPNTAPAFLRADENAPPGPAWLRLLSQMGMEVGVCGSACRFPSRRRDGSTEVFLQEVIGVKHKLEDMIGQPIRSYAYHWCTPGCWSRLTRQWVMRIGFASAVTSNWNRLNDHSDLYSLPSCEIAISDTQSDFIGKMTGKRDYLRYLSPDELNKHSF